MSITMEPFGYMDTGEEVKRFILKGKGGLTVAVLSFGATIQSVLFQEKDLVLGYDTLEGYIQGTSYQGATIGRYANRIAGGCFMLHDKLFQLDKNDNGLHHLHGGNTGFSKRVWSVIQQEDTDEPSIKMGIASPDGDGGYPGNLSMAVTVKVTADNRLSFMYEATCDKDTICNPTNHCYFNLNGWNGGDILPTQLTIYSDNITKADAQLIPTGEIVPVENTPFDFRYRKTIGEGIHVLADGYDVNYVLGQPGQWHRAAEAFDSRSGIHLLCSTDRGGLQLYTANTLADKHGKGCKPLTKHQGFCLETQFYPDTPNHPAFPSAVLAAGQVFSSRTEYQFFLDESLL